MPGRVAVIGAGSSGLVATKSMLEAGFKDVVCFERRNVLGGLWYFNKEPAKWADESSVTRATVINTSKEFTCFSDFPMPASFPNFCHNTDIEDYLKDYARHFDIEKYIKYNCEVLFVTKHKTGSSTVQWDIKVKDHKSGKETTELFDFVLVANGHHSSPHRPTFPGMEKFKGKIIHSKDYKDVSGWEGKKAVVLGIGNSGGDICSELSKYSKVFLATRRGAWVMNRLVDYGLPWDLKHHDRYTTWLNGFTPASNLTNKFRKLLNRGFDHDLYSLTPDHLPGQTHPTANDELPNRIACGMVKVKPNIQAFTETGVIFEDGTREDNIELVVLCTGYNIGFNFIDKDVIDIKENQVSLYKYMFIPGLPQQSIVFVGLVQPLGSIFPIAEMQSRLAARVFKGEVTLPSEAEMIREAKMNNEANKKQFVASQRHTIQVNWLPFMDELATLTGCKPNMWKLLVTDPVLFKAVLFGPGAPYQFRIHGPNSWPKARESMLTVMDRIQKPFQTRSIPCHQGALHENQKCSSTSVLGTVVVAALLAGIAYAARENNTDFRVYLNNLNIFKN